MVVCKMLEFPGVISAKTSAYYGEGIGQIWLGSVGCDGSENSLDECSHRGWGSHYCMHSRDAAVECLSTVRLADGNFTHEGRVEIFHDGIWGTICNTSWDINDAQVVCKMLGFPGASSAFVGDYHREGIGKIWLGGVNCSGNEGRLEDCSHSGWGSHYCAHTTDASVICIPTVRLSDGNVTNEGRVEIYHSGVWGTICDDDWDINDAKVVCRILGFPGAISAPFNVTYGDGKGQIWLSNLYCTGSEMTLEDCFHSGWGEHHCDHNEDVSVKCLAKVRLVGGQINKGRVEIYHAGVWGTICDDGWDINDAMVICRMLEFPGVISAKTRAYYGEGTGKIWLSNVGCNGSENTLDECSHSAWGSHYCMHSRDAAVECLSTVRLVDGNQVNIGRVEIYHEGAWGTICNDGWDINDAQVVCKMLGFPGATSTPIESYHGFGHIWLSGVGCFGNEERLEKCTHVGWERHNCTHAQDVSVHCLPTVRLEDGQTNKGRLEIFHDGKWGTVCDDAWDINDAEVVCRMLNFPGSISDPTHAHYKGGTGQIWISNVICNGTERSLDECSHNGWGSHHCTHGEDVSVECLSTVRLAGGDLTNEGRVEIYHSGVWGTICDDGWDIRDAKVVCRMLDFPGAISAPSSAYYGAGTDQIWLSNVYCIGSETKLKDCSHSDWGGHYCDHDEDASVKCSATVRLVEGRYNKGRVEKYHAGTWGTICDDGWDIKDAEVVCRMLEFPGVMSVPTHAYYEEGSGHIWLSNVRCNGNENTLSECSRDDWGTHHCTHREDVSVECSSTVRLVEGGVTNRGRLEIYHRGTWGTICGASWDINDAQVVCKMLEFPGVNNFHLGAHHGGEIRQIWLSNVECLGNEERLEDCTHGGWGSHHCTNGKEVSVYCLSIVRLVDGQYNNGRVEIFRNEIWGTICDDGWDISDAEVVCRMLEFPGVISARTGAYYKEGEGRIWLSNVGCDGSEMSLNKCSYDIWGSHQCTHSEDAAVECLPGVRLVDGSRKDEGRVEIYHDGVWGTICDNGWDVNDAEVVCKMLDFPGATSALLTSYHGEGTGQIWLNDVNCNGSEGRLDDCSHTGWGSHHQCTHENDVSVHCRPSVRLMDGEYNKGRVEIYHAGTWGTICDDGWDIEEARVVCQILKFPGVISDLNLKHYKEGTDRIWLSYVDCDGSESTLEECSHNGWGSHHCTHSNDVAVECLPTVRLVNGSNKEEGRLEFYQDGVWGNICGGYSNYRRQAWDERNVKVACRMLGYSDGESLTHGYFGEGNGKIWLSDVVCNGEEDILNDCKHSEWGNVNCDHDTDVSIRCFQPKDKTVLWIGITCGVIAAIAIPICIVCIYRKVRNYLSNRRSNIIACQPAENPLDYRSNGAAVAQQHNLPREAENNALDGEVRFLLGLVTQFVNNGQNIQAAPEENDPLDIPYDRLCRICMEREKNVCFSPCGHVCCCYECGMDHQNVRNCPICRISISLRVRRYE